MRKGTLAFEELLATGAPVITVATLKVGGEEVASTRAVDPARYFSIVSRPAIVDDLSRTNAAAISGVQLLVPADLVPSSVWSPFSPLQDAELTLEQGFDRGDGNLELYPLGVFLVRRSKVRRSAAGVLITVDLVDRFRRLELSPFVDPVSIAAGNHVTEIVAELVAHEYPNLELEAPQIETGTTAREIQVDTKRGALIHELTSAVGHRFKFTAAGTPRVVPMYDTDAEPVISFNVDEHPWVEWIEKEISDDAHNGAIVRSESSLDTDANGETLAPLTAEAFADNEASPIYYDATMRDAGAPGYRPLFILSQDHLDQDSVNRQARAVADDVAEAPERITIRARNVPGLETGDTVEAVDSVAGVSGKFTVARIERQVGGSMMTLSAIRTNRHPLALELLGLKRQNDTRPDARFGLVTAIDETGNPPRVTLDGVGTIGYLDAAGTLAVGDTVMWQPNGDKPVIIGKMRGTPPATVTPTGDWFHTGNAAAGHPAIGFRFWQGNANAQGEADVPTGLDPEDVLVAHATAHEYSIGLSRQWARPVVVRADGTAHISGMNPGRAFKLAIIAKNDVGAHPVYRYVATGQNVTADADGSAHPLLAVATDTDTLDGSGNRAAGIPIAGPTAANTLTMHARAMVNGESVDVSRFSQADYHTANATRAHPDGEVYAGARAAELAGQEVRLTWLYSTTNRHDNDGGAADLLVDELGRDAIGTYPLFSIVRFEGTFGGGGRLNVPILPAPIATRSTLVASGHEGRHVAAEMYSEGMNVWQLADPNRAGELNGETVGGIAFVLTGGDTAEPV